MSEDELVDVPGEHGRGREDRRVCRAHDGSRDGPEAEEGDVAGREVLQDQRKDHPSVLRPDVEVVGQLGRVVGHVPI